jgi:hypothetical protein
MNKVQLSYTNMSRTTTNTLDNNISIVTTIPGLSDALARLKRLQTELQTYSQSQATDTSGVTAEKNIVRDKLILLIMKICAAMIAIATNKNDIRLKAKFNFKKSDFPRMRDQDLYTNAINIYNNALPQADKIAPFATPDDIAQVKTLADEFYTLLPLNRTLTSQGATSTANLQDTIDSIMDLLTHTIDPLMKPMEFLHPTFYSDYKNARKLIDHGSRSSKNGEETEEKTT